jgi:hypothetical protein
LTWKNRSRTRHIWQGETTRLVRQAKTCVELAKKQHVSNSPRNNMCRTRQETAYVELAKKQHVSSSPRNNMCRTRQEKSCVELEPINASNQNEWTRRTRTLNLCQTRTSNLCLTRNSKTRRTITSNLCRTRNSKTCRTMSHSTGDTVCRTRHIRQGEHHSQN